MKYVIAIFLFCAAAVPIGAHSSTTSLKRFSNAALVKCFSDHQCGRDYWAVSSELARRKPTKFLIAYYWKSSNPHQRDGIILALSQIDAPEVAGFMSAAIDKKSIPDNDGVFYANDYLGQRCDSQALRFLSGSGTKKYFQLAACPDWARTVLYFGKCQYTPAACFLVNSLDSQCLDIGNAAAKSLADLFPDAPKTFASVSAMKEYFSNRIATHR